MTFFRKLRSIFGHARRDAEIREELQFHLDEEAAEGRAAGLSDAHARQAARRDLGNVALVAEDARAAWSWRGLEHLAQDLVYAGRMIRRRVGFTAAALLSLALGIGANVAIFSLLDALLMQQLPVHRPSELVQLVEPTKQSPVPLDRFTYSTYDRLREGATTLTAIAVMTDDNEGDVEHDGARHRAVTQLVSENYFEFFGIAAAAGRVFHPASDGATSGLVAVISDSYWRRQFGGSTAALGATIRRGTLAFSVVGVAPRGFKGVELEAAVDAWFLFNQVIPPHDEDRTRGRWVRIVGRLGGGATPEQVSSQASSILGRALTFRPGGRAYSALRNQLYRPLLLVMVVVVLVLLITCANLANLTFAANLARERELAVRRALGASRWRIIRQLLTETLLLALAGGAGAVLAASSLSAALLGFLPPQFAPALIDLRFALNLRVMAIAAAMAIATSLAIALLPALYSTRSTMSSELRIKSGAKRTRSWTTRSLIVGEIAICSLLLMLAGVFLRSVQNLRGQDAGYAEQHLLVADVGFPGRDDPRRDQKLQELRERVESLPGVQVVAYSNAGQLSGSGIEWRIGFPDRPFSRETAPQVIENRVTPGFFAAMGTRLLEGREFTAIDTESSPPVAIVNDLFAATYFPGRSPIGQRFFRDGGSSSREPVEIVGVVQSARWLNLRSAPAPLYYRPYSQVGGTPVVRFAIRGSGDSVMLAAAVSAAATSIDRDVRLANVVPFREIVNRGLVIERLVAYVSSVFGLLGLLIAAIGLYGVLAYSVARRRREIGVRIAVGATRGAVERMFLRESFALFVVGLLIGVPIGIAVIRSVASMLYGVAPEDPSGIVAVALVLGSATAAAAYLPARRAAAIDPIVALREE